MRDSLSDAAIAAIGSKATTAGAAASVLGWLTASELAALLGVLVAVVGLWLNWHYRARQDMREQLQAAREVARHEAAMERHRTTMSNLEGKPKPPPIPPHMRQDDGP